MKLRKQQEEAVRRVVGGFFYLEILWSGDEPRFYSEHSARWFVRKHKRRLAGAKAIGKHAGQLIVHPERFDQVIESEAVAALAGEE